jgi:hypothetical protein
MGKHRASESGKHDSGKTSDKPAASDGKHSKDATPSSTSKPRTDAGKLLGYRRKGQ